MAEIPKTLIATSDPLSICNGFALFPKLGTFRSGYVGTNMANTIFSIKDENLLLFRLSANAKYEVIAGVCGPAYAVEMELEGSTGHGDVELTVAGDEIQAGILFGLTLSFVLGIQLDAMKLKWVWNGWKSDFEASWSKLLDFHVNLEFDAIEFIYECIELALESEHEQTMFKKVPHISNQLIASWGMYDEQKGKFASNGGKMVATPTLNIPIDITPMIEELAAFNLILKPFFSRLSFGPLIGIQVPVKVSMKSVTLANTKYSNLDFNGVKVSGTTTGADPVDPTTINVELEHTAGFDLSFGLFCNLNLVKLFNIGFSTTWPLLKMLGIEPKPGSHANNLSTTIGKTTAKACRECGSGSPAIYDVIFEPPGGLAI